MRRKFKSLRWILLAAGIIAVISITGMNVYSLYTMRNNSIKSARQSQKIQVAEFSDRIRYRFFKPFQGLSATNMHKLQQRFKQTGHFSAKTRRIFYQASQDSIFNNLYYIPSESNACKQDQSILKFDPSTRQFVPSRSYSHLVCDGLGIARTRMQSLISNYRYNNKVLFDTHRSMIIALVNSHAKSIIGYLAMPINRSYMIDHFLQPKLVDRFGPNSKASLDVWLRNWTNGKIIASSNPGLKFNPDNIEFRQKFPDFFDDWRLYASINKQSMAAAMPSLWVNLLILSAAFIFLIGAMLFLFITAQRERSLARRQSDFLANVTHELKTPISVMRAAGENLADGRINDQSRLQSYGTHIHNQAVRLQKMINRLLEVAKADAGQSFIHPRSIAIDQVVKNFIDKEKYHFDQKGFNLNVSIDEPIAPVMVDEQSLQTILHNLVNNAIKYSNDEEFVGIDLSQANNHVILKITDHGVGMSKQALKHIFEKFYRAEDTLTAKTKGYGLGLSIVKNLVELNNGTITVESEKGKGSTFIVRFPAQKTLDSQTPASTKTSSAHLAPHTT